MITSKDGSGLIAGAFSNKEKNKMPEKQVKATVTRPFRYNGKRLDLGFQGEFSEGFAREMLAANKIKLGSAKIDQKKENPSEKK